MVAIRLLILFFSAASLKHKLKAGFPDVFKRGLVQMFDASL